MPVDLSFELSYLLSDKLGVDVEVKSYEYDAEHGVLCVEAIVGGEEQRGCVELRACKGLSGARLERCLSKQLVDNEVILERLAGVLGGGDKTG